MTRYFFIVFFLCVKVAIVSILGRPLWREEGSVVCTGSTDRWHTYIPLSCEASCLGLPDHYHLSLTVNLVAVFVDSFFQALGVFCMQSLSWSRIVLAFRRPILKESKRISHCEILHVCGKCERYFSAEMPKKFPEEILSFVYLNQQTSSKCLNTFPSTGNETTQQPSFSSQLNNTDTLYRIWGLHGDNCT
jgi:hypothetical protein